jgi:multiple sugar transport system substrate-binding protein
MKVRGATSPGLGEQQIMDRRTFLKNGALFGGGLLALPALLAACGGNQEGQTEAAGAAFELPADRQVDMEYWQILPNAEEIYRGINRRFGEDHPNVTVKVTTVPTGDYVALAQKLQAALAAGNPPALAATGNESAKYVASSLPHMSIEEAAGRDPEGRGMGWLSETFPDYILDLGRVDGTLHFMPYGISLPVLWYNRDALERAGLREPPETWDEVREYARRITERTDLLGLTMSVELYSMHTLVESNGARVLIEEGDGYRCGIDSPEAAEAIGMLADMVLKDKSTSAAQTTQALDNFVSGKTAMFVISNAALGLFKKNAAFPFGATTYPSFGDKPRRLPAGGHQLGIFAEDETQRAAAWEYLKYLISPEALTGWVEGSAYLPLRPELADEPRYLKSYYEENPIARIALEQLPDVVSTVAFPGENGLQANQALVDAFDRIFAGKEDAAPALREAARRVDQLLAPNA